MDKMIAVSMLVALAGMAWIQTHIGHPAAKVVSGCVCGVLVAVFLVCAVNVAIAPDPEDLNPYRRRC